MEMVQQPEVERIVEGFGVSPGIGIGLAYVFDGGQIRVPEYHVPAAQVDAERRRLRDAVIRARRQIGRLRRRLKERSTAIAEGATEDMSYLLEAYLEMLRDSRLVRGAHERIGRANVNAEAAVHAELAAICDAFRIMHDPYLSARVDDIREVGNRILRQLTRQPSVHMPALPTGSILVAEELTPADAAQLDPDAVAGIAAQSGGPQGHTAIMARALGLPAVLGATGLMDRVKTGDVLLLDGTLGQVVLHPTPQSILAFQRRQAERRREEKELTRLRRQPAVTRDGTRVGLLANVELPIEMDHVIEVGAAGIGLLRTEFLFLNRSTMPNEDEQYALIRELVERAGGNPVTIRTLDLGGDKGAVTFVEQFGASVSSPLGLRGIRLSLARSELLDVQFRAILRAAAHGPVRIVLPMVTSIAEMRAARDILARAARRLLRRGQPIAPALPPIGTMIETPAAALTADALAQVSDFFAVGSNDLTMYTLAIDRGDERVAHLYNTLHPAVLRMIQFSAAAAQRTNIPLSVCGEIAGDPRYTALLLGLGFRELSMSPANVPRVKRRILEIDVEGARQRAARIMEEIDPVRVQFLLDQFNKPEIERDAG
jgi:phosphotransferase system enzyme I (PtsI)